MYKNIKKEEVLYLKDQIDYLEGQVVSKTLVQNESVSITLFSFDENEEISTHSAKGDAMLTILEGKAKIIINGVLYNLSAGQTIVMPKDIPHSVTALEKIKMFLVVSY